MSKKKRRNIVQKVNKDKLKLVNREMVNVRKIVNCESKTHKTRFK